MDGNGWKRMEMTENNWIHSEILASLNFNKKIPHMGDIESLDQWG